MTGPEYNHCTNCGVELQDVRKMQLNNAEPPIMPICGGCDRKWGRDIVESFGEAWQSNHE